jgi:tRNA splicing endonuclease
MQHKNNIPSVDFNEFLDDDLESQDTPKNDTYNIEKYKPTNKEINEVATEIAAEKNYATRMNIQMMEPSESQSVLVNLPKYLIKELNHYQADNEVTRRYVIIKALKDMGFYVKDIDMFKDGRSKKR